MLFFFVMFMNIIFTDDYHKNSSGSYYLRVWLPIFEETQDLRQKKTAPPKVKWAKFPLTDYSSCELKSKLVNGSIAPSQQK